MLHVQLNKLRYGLQEKVTELGKSLPSDFVGAATISCDSDFTQGMPPSKSKRQLLTEMEAIEKARQLAENKLDCKNEELSRLKRRLLALNTELLQKQVSPKRNDFEREGGEPEMAAG